MTVTNVLTDQVDDTKTLTVGSVDGTKITAVTNGTSPPTRTLNGADLDRAVGNVNNVGLTPSAFLAQSATVSEPSGSGSGLSVVNHATNAALVLVTIASDTRTVVAAELRDAIANALRNS